MSKEIIKFVKIIESFLNTSKYKYVLKITRDGYKTQTLSIRNFIVINSDNKLIMQIISDNHYYVKVADKSEYGSISCKFILYAIYKETYIPIYEKEIHIQLNIINCMTQYNFILDEEIDLNFYLYNTKFYHITLPMFIIPEYFVQKLLYKKILKIINIDYKDNE